MGRAKKVVLAYSGGVDTSVCIPYLKQEWGVEDVITFAADLGQGDELEPIRQKALDAGASQSLVGDLIEPFIKDFAFPAIRANALYEGRYPLSTALARPLIAKRLVEVAREVGADAVAHGCTGKGNDQVRFDVAIAALAPDLKVLTPARESKSRVGSFTCPGGGKGGDARKAHWQPRCKRYCVGGISGQLLHTPSPLMVCLSNKSGNTAGN